MGRGIAAIMAQRGASVAVADIDAAGTDETAAAIAADGGEARAYAVDVNRSRNA